MASRVGSRRWAQRNCGRLSRRDRLTLVSQAVSLQFSELVGKFGALFTGHRHDADFDINNIPIPDSAMAKAAEELAADVYRSVLNLHCIRTYYWGALFGQADKLLIDYELLYVTSILHDLVLTKQHIRKVNTCCFAVTGANAAAAFVREHGWDDTRSNRVFEAISLHLNLRTL